MSTLVISTMTFSWCAEIAPSATTGPSGGSNSGDPSSPSSAPGGYEFGTVQHDERAAPTLGASLPSTFATVVVRSSLSQDISTESSVMIPNEYCGGAADHGEFTFHYDDFPISTSSEVENDDVQSRPISTPYHRFWYSEGFDVVSASDLYSPSSGNQMIRFTPPSNSNNSESDLVSNTASIDVGPQRFGHCFAFDFHGVSLGCDSTDAPCAFTFTGLSFNPITHVQTEVVSMNVNIPACSQTGECALTPVNVSNFNGVTAVHVTLKVNDEDETWWADDLVFGWSDDDCDIGACRALIPNTVTKETWSVRQVAGKLATLLGFRG
ncbi:hypothetical protein GGR57DRAFT_471578 [Xylariaceae sp. FL1272]|nr:hypothetical protein GGR57DRAFT_471578 [Xylariaceae sp. FL1272]